MSRPPTWKRVIDAIESGKLCELDDHSACRRCIPITPLHVVALTGDRDAALRILHDGGNVCFTNGSGTLPIHLAAYKGHAELVRELMCWGWPSPIGRVIWPGRRGYKSGALITALRIAGARKHVDTCKAIIGGMMAYERAIGRDLLNLSGRAREGDVVLVDIILSNGHDMLPPPTLAMALRGAIEGNHPSIMEALLQHDAPLHLHRKGEPSAFTVACDLERVELLNVMLVYGVRMDLEEEGETPLTRACRLGNAMTAKHLLEKAAPSKKEIKACFARACKVGYTAVAEQLYRTGLFSSEELKKGASCAARHGSDELKSACLQWSDDRSWEEQLQGVFRVMWLCKQTDESILSALPNEMMWELNDWVGGGLSEEDAAREAANFQAKRTLKGRLRKLLKSMTCSCGRLQLLPPSHALGAGALRGDFGVREGPASSSMIDYATAARAVTPPLPPLRARGRVAPLNAMDGALCCDSASPSRPTRPLTISTPPARDLLPQLPVHPFVHGTSSAGTPCSLWSSSSLSTADLGHREHSLEMADHDCLHHLGGLTDADGNAVGGHVYISCMPGSTTFDACDRMKECYAVLHEQARAAGPLLVGMMTPDDEALRMRGEERRTQALCDQYSECGYEVLRVVVDGFEPSSRRVLHERAVVAAEAVKNGRTLVSHCHSGMGRGAVFSVYVAALVRGDTSPEGLQRTLEWARTANEKILAKPNPLAFYLSMGEYPDA